MPHPLRAFNNRERLDQDEHWNKIQHVHLNAPCSKCGHVESVLFKPVSIMAREHRALSLDIEALMKVTCSCGEQFGSGPAFRFKDGKFRFINLPRVEREALGGYFAHVMVMHNLTLPPLGEWASVTIRRHVWRSFWVRREGRRRSRLAERAAAALSGVEVKLLHIGPPKKNGLIRSDYGGSAETESDSFERYVRGELTGHPRR